MGGEGDEPLRALRGALRTPIPDVETLAFLLSTALAEIHLGPTSIPATLRTHSLRALTRHLPTIQAALLSNILPTFIDHLEARHLELVKTLFVPKNDSTRETLHLRRTIAGISYTTFSPFLSQKPSLAAVNGVRQEIPVPIRAFFLEMLDDLNGRWKLDSLYWSVWSTAAHEEGSKDATIRELRWEESVRCIVGLPTKVANVVGRWKAEQAWSGDMSDRLVPRTYFHQLVRNMEELMYELSQRSPATHIGLSVVIHRLASIGLLSRKTPDPQSRQPSFWEPILPPLLAHLHPPQTSPLAPYPPSYLPSLFLSLPSSIIYSLAGSLIHHLTAKSNYFDGLAPESPDARVKRAAEVLQLVLGPASVESEAFEAVSSKVLTTKSLGNDANVHAVLRMVVTWISFGGDDVVIHFLDQIMAAWSDAKHIKFALYLPQKNLTHLLLLTISQLAQYHPHVIYLSHQGRFLSAIQSYLAHLDPAIRRLGMLVGEAFSERTIVETETAPDAGMAQEEEIAELKAGFDTEDGVRPTKTSRGNGPKRLRFGSRMWDGDGEGKEEARWLRACLGIRDGDVHVGDDPSGEIWLLGWTVREEDHSEKTVTTLSTTGPTRGRKPIQSSRSTTAQAKKSTHRPKIIMLDEEQTADPLEGYEAPSPSSSRSPSPTPSYLEEVTADPSLAFDSVQKKKVTRPVYISQLVALLSERDKPDSLEMGLKWGESLIRAKRSFGGELEENAPALASLVIALNDPFNLDDFDDQRQGIAVALVACSPKNVAPYLIETYFVGQYSLHQRSVILTALAMGARELAGLTVPMSTSTRKVDFASKVLPAGLHNKYVSPGDLDQRGGQSQGQLEAAVDGIRGLMISKGVKRGEDQVPELAREKRLRVGKSTRPKVAEIGTTSDRQMVNGQSSHGNMVVPPSQARQQPVVAYRDIATEYFLMPMINRFWEHFNDSSVRETRAIQLGDRYRGAGTGMILSPLALEKFLMTLVLLVHAARHSNTFLAVISPEVLELAVAIGIRYRPQQNIIQDPISTPQIGLIGKPGSKGADGVDNQEGSVIAAALELALVSLDTAFDLDGGRTLATDKSDLLMAAGEWATGIFGNEEKGEDVMGGQGGLREGRIRAMSAGVVLKVSDIAEKWGRMSFL